MALRWASFRGASLWFRLNDVEALGLLREALASFRSMSFLDLRRLLEDGLAHSERFGSSGVAYQLEIEAMWDERKGGPIRVVGSIDDGGFRALSPLSDSFLVPPEAQESTTPAFARAATKLGPTARIALPYTFRAGSPAHDLSFGNWEFARFDALTEYMPWRGVAITLGLIAAWFAASRIFPAEKFGWGWMVALALGVCACVSELAFRRDRLTLAGIERRTGVLGRRVLVVPYRKIESVEVVRNGPTFGGEVGTVVVGLRASHLRLVSVLFPHEIAWSIESSREDSTKPAGRREEP